MNVHSNAGAHNSSYYAVFRGVDIFPNGSRINLNVNYTVSDAGGDDWMGAVVDEFKRNLYTHQEPRTKALITIYALIFVMALGGNVLVLLVMVANNSMRSVTNFFLLNLAISDLLGEYMSTCFSDLAPASSHKHQGWVEVSLGGCVSPREDNFNFESPVLRGKMQNLTCSCQSRCKGLPFMSESDLCGSNHTKR